MVKKSEERTGGVDHQFSKLKALSSSPPHCQTKGKKERKSEMGRGCGKGVCTNDSTVPHANAGQCLHQSGHQGGSFHPAGVRVPAGAQGHLELTGLPCLSVASFQGGQTGLVTTLALQPFSCGCVALCSCWPVCRVILKCPKQPGCEDGSPAVPVKGLPADSSLLKAQA
jgi:hypothetical protein